MITTLLTFIFTVLTALIFVGICITPFYLIGAYCRAFYKDLRLTPHP